MSSSKLLVIASTANNHKGIPLMTTSTPSSRGARRRNSGRRSGAAERFVRAAEPAFATPAPALPSLEPVPVIDYITDFIALGVPARIANVGR